MSPKSIPYAICIGVSEPGPPKAGDLHMPLDIVFYKKFLLQFLQRIHALRVYQKLWQ